MPEIRNVTVIGAGVMGAGIAAQVANAGVSVSLLDVVPKGASNRNVVAENALKKILSTNPAPLMDPRFSKRIVAGNIEDNLASVGDSDLIIEAVIEDIKIKQEIYAEIEAIRKIGSIVTSNTSTIPLSQLTNGLPQSFCQDFMISHFFNPPRYMRLLELVVGPETNQHVADALRLFADKTLGKVVVDCNDTPGFIANRIGIFWIEAAVRFALEMGINVEEADAIIGKPMGIPKTGVFGLLDLVGIDLQPHVQKSMLTLLPQDDLYRDIYQPSELLDKMISEGYIGRKGSGGFYRLIEKDGVKIKQALDLSNLTYRDLIKPQLESIMSRKIDLEALLSHPDPGGQYAWKVMSHTLSYAASLVPEITDNIHSIDQAMRNGYAWKWGPFEMMDQLGSAWFANRLEKSNMAIPQFISNLKGQSFYKINNGGKLQYYNCENSYQNIKRPTGVILLSDLKRKKKKIDGNNSASLWDIGDNVMCLEFHTKMNSLDSGVFKTIEKAIKKIPSSDFQALVIHNDNDNFSVGVNLGLALFAANIAAWPEITKIVVEGQKVYKALKYAPFPVVSAPSGMVLGGACELLLHSDAVQAHAESYIGLVEVGVGLIPAWGGCKEMLHRWQQLPKHPKGPMSAVIKVFEIIGTATVARSAEEAKHHLFLRSGDGITMNRDRLLGDAKDLALSLVSDYSPPEKPEFVLPGKSGKLALNMAVSDLCKMGKATAHDMVVADSLAKILTGDDVDITQTLSEDQMLSLERKSILELLKTKSTLARMEHMLEKGKPLRN